MTAFVACGIRWQPVVFSLWTQCILQVVNVMGRIERASYCVFGRNKPAAKAAYNEEGGGARSRVPKGRHSSVEGE